MLITGSPINDTSVQEAEVKYNALSITSPYKDLGLVIDATNMAAGATVYSNWIDGVEWVRNMVLMVSTDQQYDINFKFREPTNTMNTGAMSIQTGQTANIGVFRLTGQSGLVGNSFAIGLKNSSASPNTYGKLRAQLMGL